MNQKFVTFKLNYFKINFALKKELNFHLLIAQIESLQDEIIKNSNISNKSDFLINDLICSNK
jgi:hypothetical protein